MESFFYIFSLFSKNVCFKPLQSSEKITFFLFFCEIKKKKKFFRPGFKNFDIARLRFFRQIKAKRCSCMVKLIKIVPKNIYSLKLEDKFMKQHGKPLNLVQAKSTRESYCLNKPPNQEVKEASASSTGKGLASESRGSALEFIILFTSCSTALPSWLRLAFHSPFIVHACTSSLSLACTSISKLLPSGWLLDSS